MTNMKKTIFSILIMLIILLAGCSVKESEKNVFEEISNEKLAEIKFENDLYQQNINNSKLKEIIVQCIPEKDSRNKISGLNLDIVGIGKTKENELVYMNNLNGDIEINIYGINSVYNQKLYTQENKKDKLIASFKGNINEITTKEQVNIQNKINSYYYTKLITIENINQNNLPQKINYFDEAYENNYLQYPILVEVKYKENDKEFITITKYLDYGFGPVLRVDYSSIDCSIYNFEEKLSLTEPNNKIAYKEIYIKDNLRAIDVNVTTQDAVIYSLAGTIKNNGNKNISSVELKITYLEGEDREISSQNIEVLYDYNLENILKSNGGEYSFNKGLYYDAPPLTWNGKIKTEITNIEFKE